MEKNQTCTKQLKGFLQGSKQFVAKVYIIRLYFSKINNDKNTFKYVCMDPNNHIYSCVNMKVIVQRHSPCGWKWRRGGEGWGQIKRGQLHFTVPPCRRNHYDKLGSAFLLYGKIRWSAMSPCLLRAVEFQMILILLLFSILFKNVFSILIIYFVCNIKAMFIFGKS